MSGMGSHQSSVMGTEVWLTPPSILEALGPFDLDPCAPLDRPWDTAREHYTEQDDGLARFWFGRVWLNPPYGRLIVEWMRRMAAHGYGTALVFARTETEWFFHHVWPKASALLFLEGRLNFHRPDGTRSKKNAGAPSVLVAYGAEDAEILAECGLGGKFVPLLLPRLVPVEGVEFAHGIGGETWREVVMAVFRSFEGGPIALDALYRALTSHPKVRGRRHWKAKVRQTVQRAEFERVDHATYRLARQHRRAGTLNPIGGTSA